MVFEPIIADPVLVSCHVDIQWSTHLAERSPASGDRDGGHGRYLGTQMWCGRYRMDNIALPVPMSPGRLTKSTSAYFYLPFTVVPNTNSDFVRQKRTRVRSGVANMCPWWVRSTLKHQL